MIKKIFVLFLRKAFSPALYDVNKRLARISNQIEDRSKGVNKNCRLLEYNQIYMYYSLLFEQADFTKSLLSENKREKPLVVTMTSIPYRIHKAHITVESIFRQSLKPDYVVLNLDRSIFSDENLPWALKRQKSRGLTINYVDDIGPFTKIIPTMKLFPNALYVTADDDMLYTREWLEKLYTAYLSEPEYIHCHRPHIMTFDEDGNLDKYRNWEMDVKYTEEYASPSFNIFPTGVGGVIYSYGHFDEELFKESVFLQLSPNADDVWLKAMSLKNNVKCKILPNRMDFNKKMVFFNMSVINDTQEQCLHHSNYLNDKNDPQIKAVFDKYNLYEKLEVI